MDSAAESISCAAHGPSSAAESTSCAAHGPSSAAESTSCATHGPSSVAESISCAAHGPSSAAESTSCATHGPSSAAESTSCVPFDASGGTGRAAAQGMGEEEWAVERLSRGDRALRGAFAGLIGSIVMGVVGLAVAGMQGPAFSVPMSVFADLLLEGRGTAGYGGELYVLGGILHMLVGSALGAIFGALLPARAHIPGALGGGVVYGLFLHLVVFYGILDEIPAVREADVSTWAFLAEHLVFGLTVGIVMAAWLSSLRSERVTERPA